MGPQGPPGASLIDELRNVNSIEDHLLISRLESLSAFVGPKGNFKTNFWVTLYFSLF